MSSLAVLDSVLMRRALESASRARGSRGGRPTVAALAADGDVVLGEAVTGLGGSPHAEARLLSSLGERARGATIYSTLEPCSHVGRSPPCADALVASGARRVVIALEDPDPRVDGRGIDRLRSAGIEVVVGVERESALRHHAGFLSRVVRGRPWTILKIAASRDGKIAARRGVSTLITGERSRRAVHELRARVDAVLVGAETLRVDVPRLTCRLDGESSEANSPRRVAALGRGGATPPDDGGDWTLLVPDVRRDEIDGGRVVRCRSSADGLLDMSDALRRLAEEGVNSLLVEGGARIASALDVVDEFLLFESPMTLGESGVSAPPRPRGMLRVERVALGDDRMTRWENPRSLASLRAALPRVFSASASVEDRACSPA